MNYFSRFALVAAAFLFVGAGCTPTSTKTSQTLSSGPFASVSSETHEDGTLVVTLNTRGEATSEDFYDVSKLPMPADNFYSDDPVSGLGEPARTYKDEDGDTNRLYTVKGGVIAAIETDGDPLSIVEYRPDDLAAADFLKPEVMAQLPATGAPFVRVLNDGDENDILFLVDIKDGKVVSVSP